MNILITGGAGYIGSHALIELINSGHTPVVVDNLSNSSQEAIHRVEKIVNQPIPFYDVTVQNENELREVFEQYSFEAIIHFAGLKSVGESVREPLKYYINNIDSTLTLLKLAEDYAVKKFIFSSSATVYGTPAELPLIESSRVGVGLTNPYGRTKYMLEEVLKDMSIADSTLEITILRYFNPIGAHESGTIGEDPSDIPNNLLPYIAQVAVGKLDHVNVFGNDYDTIDGTGVRDYIHVVDLAKGHVAALDHSEPGVAIYNLATGKGTSVLELISAFSKSVGKAIPYEIAKRRPGDIASCYASPELAAQKLGWKTELSIQDGCDSSWKWQSQNPDGYRK
jgi:UDP-glucose 4-epimerase